MCFFRHAEHHARNRTSLAGLEKDLLFFGPPYNNMIDRRYSMRAFVSKATVLITIIDENKSFMDFIGSIAKINGYS